MTIRHPSQIPPKPTHPQGNATRAIPIDIVAEHWQQGKSMLAIVRIINEGRTDPFKMTSLEKAIAKARKRGDKRFPYRREQYDPNR